MKFTFKGGMYWLQLFDWYSASITVILICLIEVVIVGWTYGVSNFVKDIEFMIQKNVHWYWIISCKFSAPLILSVFNYILNDKNIFNIKLILVYIYYYVSF